MWRICVSVAYVCISDSDYLHGVLAKYMPHTCVYLWHKSVSVACVYIWHESEYVAVLKHCMIEKHLNSQLGARLS